MRCTSRESGEIELSTAGLRNSVSVQSSAESDCHIRSASIPQLIELIDFTVNGIPGTTPQGGCEQFAQQIAHQLHCKANRGDITSCHPSCALFFVHNIWILKKICRRVAAKRAHFVSPTPDNALGRLE